MKKTTPSPRQRVRSKIVKKIDCDKCYDIGDTGWGRRDQRDLVEGVAAQPQGKRALHMWMWNKGTA